MVVQYFFLLFNLKLNNLIRKIKKLFTQKLDNTENLVCIVTEIIYPRVDFDLNKRYAYENVGSEGEKIFGSIRNASPKHSQDLWDCNKSVFLFPMPYSKG